MTVGGTVTGVSGEGDTGVGVGVGVTGAGSTELPFSWIFFVPLQAEYTFFPFISLKVLTPT